MAREDAQAENQHEVSDGRAAEVEALCKHRKRKAPTLCEKLASALLTICRPDASGKFVPVIDPEEAKELSTHAVISKFEWDHVVLHALGGLNHPSNLVPRPKAEHREKSKRDTSIVAKARRLAPEIEEHRRRMLAKTGRGEAPEKDAKPKAKIQSRGFQGSRKFDDTVTWKK